MTPDARSPVIVGVGQVRQRCDDVVQASEPIDLMARAIRRASDDTGRRSLPNIVGSIRVVNCLSWRYGNPAALLADRLGVTAREFAYTPVGGNVPQALVNRTAQDIADGRLDMAVLAGGEAWRTRRRATHAGHVLDWDTAARRSPPPTVIGDELSMTHPVEAARGVVLPVHVYPMFETAIRAAVGHDPDDHRARISELWSRFSTVAAGNPHAWSRTAMTPGEIGTPTATNRMIGWPYTKAMNSNNDVDMAAAVILCSAEHAVALGVDRSRWIFVHSGVDCHEHDFVSHRDTFAQTPAVRIGGRRALRLAGAGIDDVGLFDLYSCFPSAVQLGAASLGLDLDRQLTRTGGLSFAGGPWNNYVMHAIATVVGELRDRTGELALVWGNGGLATKHSIGVYGTEPPAAGFRTDAPQPEIDALPRREVIGGDAAGPAAIEAYTVMHDRDGSPGQAFASCLRSDGRRAWATTRDHATMAAMKMGEWVGATVSIEGDGTLRV